MSCKKFKNNFYKTFLLKRFTYSSFKAILASNFQTNFKNIILTKISKGINGDFKWSTDYVVNTYLKGSMVISNGLLAKL